MGLGLKSTSKIRNLPLATKFLLDQTVSSSLKPWPSLVNLIYSRRGHLCGCSTYSEPTAAGATTPLNKHFFQLMRVSLIRLSKYAGMCVVEEAQSRKLGFTLQPNTQNTNTVSLTHYKQFVLCVHWFVYLVFRLGTVFCTCSSHT